MKYLYIGVGVLAVLLAACILSTTVISSCTRETADALEHALSAFDEDDFPAAAAQASRAKSEWDQHAKLLSALLSHEELDEIDTAFTALDSYRKTQTADEFRSRCAELSLRLRHITQMDIPFYYNFFVRPLGT